MSATAIRPIETGVCPDCDRRQRHADTLGRLRSELQHQVNVLELRLRVAEARVVDLERALNAVGVSLHEGGTWNRR